MKKQVLAALLFFASVSVSFAAPIVIGDVVFKDELIILNKNIVCSAFAAPADDVRSETLIYGTYSAAIAKDGSIMVNGELDGDSFQISGKPNESLNLSLQQSAKVAGGKGPAYSFSSNGIFTNQIIRGKAVKTTSLTVLLNGKHKNVGCSIN